MWAMQTDLEDFLKSSKPSYLKLVRPIDFGVIHLGGMMGPLASFNPSQTVEPGAGNSFSRDCSSRVLGRNASDVNSSNRKGEQSLTGKDLKRRCQTGERLSDSSSVHGEKPNA